MPTFSTALPMPGNQRWQSCWPSGMTVSAAEKIITIFLWPQSIRFTSPISHILIRCPAGRNLSAGRRKTVSVSADPAGRGSKTGDGKLSELPEKNQQPGALSGIRGKRILYVCTDRGKHDWRNTGRTGAAFRAVSPKCRSFLCPDKPYSHQNNAKKGFPGSCFYFNVLYLILLNETVQENLPE